MSFSTLLVANRGEIAVRVLRAARTLGLRTVAVYSDADREAPHVRHADVAVRLGPEPATASYLSIPALLDAAARSGADAVHPGYGFLSERAEFARACRDAGLVFVGPTPEVIDLMGRKDEARRVAAAAGVPMLPAVEGADDAELLARARAEIGFPLLVKAASGGGGKGMRIVRSDADLPAALAAARREALAAFGDDTMLIERYLEHGRHIEVQVLADSHGRTIHLYDRDCSVQRRHQKVVEEAPAPTISDHVRSTVTEAAVRLARQVGYVNAGTVEFLAAGEDAYFLEMNTRLQVEHPVTELVTGVDLVAAQLRIAQGEPLELAQEDVALSGHAIEARVYAEDPGDRFLPQAGLATRVRWPRHVRVDEALESGQRVGTWYDPMLAKVISFGRTREDARRALVAALDDSAIIGLTTNLGFLRRLTDSATFREASLDTAWLDRHPGAFPSEGSHVATCVAAWTLATADRGRGDHPFGVGDGWRLGGRPAGALLELEHREERLDVHVDAAGGRIRLGERTWSVRALHSGPGRARLEIDGVAHEAEVEANARQVTVVHEGESYLFRVPDPLVNDDDAPTDEQVSAPMPGLVREVSVTNGQAVSKGDALGVLEAMKMEMALVSPHDGTVDRISITPGDQVVAGQELFTIAASH
ncbi:acetyl/propionyl/methylcrotonyl-CoA carboxylase subunit alpha [Georgenia yuyongxinii]|uniref:Biotin-dependent 3-methylcrotonyl-coenzyme A carboxylase alpha1 subunit n=1 Tax=Georgenia yuyongxinii TaxID=2589797 RepID=A0A552WYD8_9MICO|nr:biotin carboxylase N-terminal domain-containing protein [Georgenia yuyongxinii]TRW47629.1 biotin/lipoyl-binding protein [Georgenia yuyongxinii]